jgi:transcriptional regulator with XRE-family HTH domain
MEEGDIPLTPVILRQRTKKTQRQLAQALGKKVTTISDWERGVKKPRLTFSEVKLLMKELDCSLDELIEAFETNFPVKKINNSAYGETGDLS